MTTPNSTYKPKLDMIALLIILCSFAIRYWFVDSGQLNLVQDEAQYWDWIRRPQLSYYSKGPLIAWMIATWTQVFGNTELGIRFGSILGMAGIQTAIYFGVSRVWREHRLALFALFVAATMPLLNGLGILATTDNPLIFCWTVAFFALSAATRNEPDHTPGKWPFVILTACIAVGILAKYMMLAFLGLALPYALILQMRGQMPKRFWSRFALAALVGTVLGLLPIILWNMNNDWVAYKHVAKLSTGEDKPFHWRIGPFFEGLGAQIGLIAPWWFVFILMGSRKAWKKSIVGPVGNFDATYRNTLQAVIFFWPLWAAITFWNLHSKVEANWTAASFMAGALIACMGLMRWWDAPHRKNRGRVIMASTATVLCVIIYLAPVIPTPDNMNPTHRLKGWADLGMKVDELRRTEFDNPEKVFFLSNEYGMTSELAFYVPEQPITYCTWTRARRMNQYDLWPSPAVDKIGWDAVLVGRRFHQSHIREFEELFDSVSQPIHYRSTFNGQPARDFEILICKGFNGTWPQVGLGKY